MSFCIHFKHKIYLVKMIFYVQEGIECMHIWTVCVLEDAREDIRFPESKLTGSWKPTRVLAVQF